MTVFAGNADPGSSGLSRSGRALLQLYPRGLKLFMLAPMAVALVVLPQFLQHIFEIQLGMFDSREAFIALQHDPARWAFGYAKLIGLPLAMLASARFWWTREHGGCWWNLRQAAWGRFAAGFLIFFGIGALPELLKGALQPPSYQIVAIVWALLLLPFLFLMLAGLFGDRSTAVAAIVRRSWPWLLLTALLLVIGFGPVGWLHQMNHQWAMGAHEGRVWALMLFDSLLVGLLAGLVGTAFYLGYSAFAESEVRRSGDATGAR